MPSPSSASPPDQPAAARQPPSSAASPAASPAASGEGEAASGRSPPDPDGQAPPPPGDGNPLSGLDRRRLRRYVEQTLDHGFRLAVVEARGHAEREAILAELRPLLGAGLLCIDIDGLPQAQDNLWAALTARVAQAPSPPRCLVLWGLESRLGPDYPRQLNVQRDLFVRDLRVPWIVFIHPATRVRLLGSAPDFCDFAILWLHDLRPAPAPDRQPEPGEASLPPPFADAAALGTGPKAAHPLLGQAWAALNAARFDEARDLLDRFALIADPAPRDVIVHLLLEGELERQRGHYERAEALAREAVQRVDQDPSLRAEPDLRFMLQWNLSAILLAAGRGSEALLVWPALLPTQSALPSEGGAEALAEAMRLLLSGDLGEPRAEHEARLRRGLAAAEAGPAELRVLVPIWLWLLAGPLAADGRLPEAEALLRRALALCEQSLGPQHPQTVDAQTELARLLARQGQAAEAEALLRRALAAREAVYGGEHPKVSDVLGTLAAVLVRQGQAAEAEALLRRALAVCEKALAPRHPKTVQALDGLTLLLLSQGRYREAEPLVRRVLAIAEKVLGPQHARVQELREILTQLEVELGGG